MRQPVSFVAQVASLACALVVLSGCGGDDEAIQRTPADVKRAAVREVSQYMGERVSCSASGRDDDVWVCMTSEGTRCFKARGRLNDPADIYYATAARQSFSTSHPCYVEATVGSAADDPGAGTCEDVTSFDYNWDNDMKCTRFDGSMFYTDYEGADRFERNGDE